MSQPNDAEFSPAHAFAQAVSGEVFVQQSCQWHAQSRTAKLNFLATKGSIRGVEWQELHPDENYIWLTENLRPEFESSSFLPIGTKEAKSARIVEVGGAEAEAIFKEYSPGVQTNRDSWMYDFNARKLAIKAESMIETYNAELARWIR